MCVVGAHWYDGKGAAEIFLDLETASSVVKLSAVVGSTEHCHQLQPHIINTQTHWYYNILQWNFEEE